MRSPRRCHRERSFSDSIKPIFSVSLEVSAEESAVAEICCQRTAARASSPTISRCRVRASSLSDFGSDVRTGRINKRENGSGRLTRRLYSLSYSDGDATGGPASENHSPSRGQWAFRRKFTAVDQTCPERGDHVFASKTFLTVVTRPVTRLERMLAAHSFHTIPRRETP